MDQPLPLNLNTLSLPIYLVEFENGQVIYPDLPAQLPTQLDGRQSQIEEFLKSRHLSANTQRSYHQRFDRFLNWTDKAWQDINHRDILRYKLDLERSTLSPASVTAALVALKSLFKGLRSLGYITDDPTTAVKIRKNSQNESKPLSETQRLALSKALEKRKRSRWRDTAVLGVLSHGISASDAAGLNMEDYDGQQIYIRRARTGANQTALLNAEVCRAIETYLAHREKQGELLTPSSPMFLNEAINARFRQQDARQQQEKLTLPDRLSYRGIYNLIKDLGRIAQAALIEEGRSIEAAQLQGIHPHQLRHH